MNINGEPLPRLLKDWTPSSSESFAHAPAAAAASPPILIALHDNITLPPLSVGKPRCNVSPQGHGGLTSMTTCLKTKDFWRIGLGIGRSNSKGVAEWVLSGLSSQERAFWQGIGIGDLVDRLETVLTTVEKQGKPQTVAKQGNGKKPRVKKELRAGGPQSDQSTAPSSE